MGTLHYQFHWKESGLLKFVVVAQTRVTPNVSGHPIEVATRETIEKIHDLLLADGKKNHVILWKP